MRMTLPLTAALQTATLASAAATGVVPTTQCGSPRMIARNVAHSAVDIAAQSAAVATTTVNPSAAACAASRLPAPPDTVGSRIRTELLSGAVRASAGVAEVSENALTPTASRGHERFIQKADR